MCFRLYPPLILTPTPHPILLKLFKCPIKDKSITILSLMRWKLAFGPEYRVFVWIRINEPGQSLLLIALSLRPICDHVLIPSILSPKRLKKEGGKTKMNTAALKSCTEVIKMFERSSEELMN